MTDALDEAIEDAVRALAAIGDPVERFHESRVIRAKLDQASQALKSAQADIALELKTDRSWREVGELLNVSGSRAEQISRKK